MSGFIANALSGSQESAIASDAWWPAVSLTDMRARLRLDESVTEARLLSAAETAVTSVNDELESWRAGQQAAGNDSLSTVPARTINGKSRLVNLYLRAIDGLVGAELAERYRTYDATNSGEHRAEELTPTIDEHRRDARWAIRDILGVRRSTVELI